MMNPTLIPTLLEIARKEGFSSAVSMDPHILVPLQKIRDMCRSDRCGRYGHSWSCPPACGTLEASSSRIASYRDGILLQTIGHQTDAFDMETIRQTEKEHKKRFDRLVGIVRAMQPDCLPLGAGSCTLCKKCTYPDAPCRFPGRRYASMEAYGLWVSDVCSKCGVKYNNGENTITFSACILLNKIGGPHDSEGDFSGDAEAGRTTGATADPI